MKFSGPSAKENNSLQRDPPWIAQSKGLQRGRGPQFGSWCFLCTEVLWNRIVTFLP